MKIVKLVLLLGLLLVVYIEYNSELWQHIADKNWIAAYVAQSGFRGSVGLVLSGAVFIGCGGPRQLIAFTFGFAFGWVSGLLLCLLSTLTGTVIGYGLAHWLLKPSFNRHFAERFTRFESFVKGDPFLKLLAIRLFPIGSNLLTNLFSGAAGVPFMAFITASIVGYLPQTVIFSLAGSGIGNASRYQVIVSIVLGAISLLLTHFLYKKYKKRHAVISQ
ncbi:VTT domain-containing protein [Vibrio sp. CAU 1672]|uniref:TVP38/TMEM64 family protein n=1 Tax=Vibrio sp. CAU 1672 TaxID=3032594 RepID=UPI0023DA6A0F|nr:VTT domain-containing protein [Vibrio sp. CAU 1672]MDF2152923.1 VTT domain-containing protein [Vibrio sp. CAU 1672]